MELSSRLATCSVVCLILSCSCSTCFSAPLRRSHSARRCLDIAHERITFAGQAVDDSGLIGVGGSKAPRHDLFQTGQGLVQMLLGYCQRRHRYSGESSSKKQLFSDLT